MERLDNAEKVKELLNKIRTDEEQRLARHEAVKNALQNPKLAATLQIPSPSNDVTELMMNLLTSSQPIAEIRARRDWMTGKLIGHEEVLVDDEEGDEGDARTSMSLHRAPDTSVAKDLMGSSSNLPFMPGGFDATFENVLRFSELLVTGDSDEAKYLDFSENAELLINAPGFEFGVDYRKMQNANAGGNQLSSENVPEMQSEPLKSSPSKPEFDLENMDILDLLDFVGSSEPLIIPAKKNDESIQSETPPEHPKKPIEETDSPDDIEGLPKETLKPSRLVFRLDETVAKPIELHRDQAGNELHFARLLDSTKPVPKYLNEILPKSARQYPFNLDPFQQQAVVCLERGDSVFVAAHTSAGKTVVAEYAVALCKLHRTRAIYTSPIKALSNQKFREFKLAFEDVGLITGDIQLHPEAFCLIMTTEILRSMLYNGSEVIRELEWVIFDEVHYINDIERGHVWEEVLIMLPAHVKIIMLSATVPNHMEFADWVGRIKNRTIFVVTTMYRPVPLEHFLYTGQDGKTKKDMFLIVDKYGKYVSKGYQLAGEAKSNLRKATTGPIGYRPNNKSDKNVYINLIDHLRTKELLPVVAFVFSRKRCDENAQLLHSVDLSTAKEKDAVHTFFGRCIARLKGSDKKLPQVLQMQELCKRGFAVHHSGILPILKEVVELLFQQGLVKVLFATETFAMGVNMPARTVVFDSSQKHDGKELRPLKPGEYIQMAGRAGRRGLDSTGTVILLCKGSNLPEPTELSRMMLGKATPMESRFRVTYSMLLNLIRVEQLRIEDMLQRSFVESATLRQGLIRRERLKELEQQIADLPVLQCSICTDGPMTSQLATYHDRLQQFIQNRRNLWQAISVLPVVDKLLSAGRVLVFSEQAANSGPQLGILLKTTADNGKRFLHLLVKANGDDEQSVGDTEWKKLPELARQWLTETAVIENAAFNGLEQLRPSGSSKASDTVSYRVLNDVPLSDLIAFTHKTLKVDYQSIMNDVMVRKEPRYRSRSPDQSIARLLLELDSLTEKLMNESGDVKILLPGRDIQINEVFFFDKVLTLNQARTQLIDTDNYPCRHCTQFKDHFRMVRERHRMEDERAALEYSMSTGSLLLSQEYADKLKVLKALQYVDENNLVDLKGKVACEIHHQELLITELLLENKLHGRTPAEIAAMLSATTCQHKATGGGNGNDDSGSSGTAKNDPIIKELRGEVELISDKIAKVQRDNGIKAADPGEELNFALMHVVYNWAQGMTFSEIMEMTDAQEGLIVRCIQRLDEVCRDVRNAARIVGDPELATTMEQTSEAIKRDIVFAASLYTVA